jgi:hypothetical protein
MRAFWQGILSNAAWWIILLVGGGMFTFLKLYHPEWATALLVGLVACACIAILHFAITGHAIIHTKSDGTTPENVESRLKIWTSSLGLALIPVSNPDTYFAYRVSFPNGNSLIALRPTKARTEYLHLICGMMLSPDHALALERLTDAQATTVWNEVSLELARSKANYWISGKGARYMQSIHYQKVIPIPSLVESLLASALDEIDNTTQIVKVALTFSLQRFAEMQQQPNKQLDTEI